MADDAALTALATFETSLAQSGMDITQRFDTAWYNAYIAEESLPLQPLPTFGGRASSMAILIGNSSALWPAFLAWFGAQPDAENVVDPLDTYTDKTISLALEKLLASPGMEGTDHQLFWPWEGGERLVSMQRAAVASGLCYHDSETQLAIHPTFGAWHAYRAVLVLSTAALADALAPSAPSRLPCLLSVAEKAKAHAAMAAALHASDEANLCTQLHGAKGMEIDVRLAWAALRDCVRLGAEHRYSEAQLVYHYTKDRAVLLRALRS